MTNFLDRMPQVAVMLPPSVKVCRDMRQGVFRFARLHGPWSIHLIEDRSEPQRLSSSPGLYSGLIGMPMTAEEVRMVSRLTAPTVLIDPQFSRLSALHRRIVARASLIRCDTAEVGAFAARHFLGRGFRNFAYVGAEPCNTWSNDRRKGFAAEIRAAGCACKSFKVVNGVTMSDELPSLCAWLVKLPKPCAVLCAWDFRARQVVDAALMSGLRVPEDVSVLGVDDDEALCLSSHPPISSVQMDAERAGYDAAKLLDEHMRGRKDRAVIHYGPVGIAVRVTAPTVAVADDPVLRMACEFIAVNVARRLAVEDVARHVNVSVRALQRRFKKVMGKGVHVYIECARIERVKTMLAETNESVKSIALTCGYATVSHLTARFRRLVGLTMSEYRTRHATLVRGKTLSQMR